MSACVCCVSVWRPSKDLMEILQVLVDSVHMNAIEVVGMKLMEARSRLGACGISARMALKLRE